jgi:LacI family transcriptional regulator
VARWFAALLRNTPKPLGILCNETKDAARVLAECRFIGLAVPEEIAIIGVGDDPMLCENQSVPLSCILQNGGQIGWEAAALLARLMDGAAPPDGPLLIPPAGIAVRTSTECEAASDPLVAKALALVAQNLSRPWGVEQLAAEMGVSPASLNRRFKADRGRAPGEEIQRQRLVRAKALLRDTDLPLADIAARCGICNAPYLSNRFRRETGFSPRDWRRTIRNNQHPQ